MRSTMTVKKTCPDCGTEMNEGFVPECATLGAIWQTWHPGKPEKKGESLKLDLSSAIEVSVFRLFKLRFAQAVCVS